MSVILALSFLREIPGLNANSEDPDQMPQDAAFELGLHCLPIPFMGP